MKIQTLHPWNLSCEEAVAVQKRLSGRVRQKALRKPVKTIAGADASYSPRGQQVHAAVLVFTFPDLILVDRAFAQDTVPRPYLPGLLSFREAPALIKAFRKIQTRPDVVIFDGQGMAHPRGMGLASHMGLILDCPTIGCAKTRLVGSHARPGEDKGSAAHLAVNGHRLEHRCPSGPRSRHDGTWNCRT